jgi:lipoprotein-releasing system ATP-binding protein
MSELLRCGGLVKEYQSGSRRVKVLSGLNLTVQPGEMVGIVGESGVGKSTLLHILGALDSADSGTYSFMGADVAAMRPSERAAFRNQHVGFVFQFHHLLPELSVLENTVLPAMIGGSDRGGSEGSALKVLSELGLSEMVQQYPSELSGGEQQRVAVARALMTARHLVIADEPTGNLDPVTADRMFEVFRKAQKDRGLAAVVATHNEKLAGQCDRVMRLEAGVLRRLAPSSRAMETASQRL